MSPSGTRTAILHDIMDANSKHLSHGTQSSVGRHVNLFGLFSPRFCSHRASAPATAHQKLPEALASHPEPRTAFFVCFLRVSPYNSFDCLFFSSSCIPFICLFCQIGFIIDPLWSLSFLLFCHVLYRAVRVLHCLCWRAAVYCHCLRCLSYLCLCHVSSLIPTIVADIVMYTFLLFFMSFTFFLYLLVPEIVGEVLFFLSIK